MKKIKIIFFLGLMIIIEFMISACHFNNDPFNSVESGDFIYATNISCFNGKEDEVAIIGLSEQGKKKEIIVFPNMIDGHRVVAFGAKFGYENTGPIIIENAKKVYFCNLFIEYNNVKTYFEYKTNNIEIFIGGSGTKQHKPFGEFLDENSVNYVDEYLYQRFNSLYSKDFNLSVATIVYYIEEESCYFVDYVENEKVNVIPPEPYKEGYIFDGWYKNLEYTEKWDFDNDIVVPSSKEKEFEEDVDYEPIKIYAKWNENNR